MNPAEDLRSVASAANALARALPDDNDAIELALERLELHARRVADDATRGFGPGDAETEEELLATALTQLEISSALIAAEHAVAQPDQREQLRNSAAQLETTADAIDNLDRVDTRQHGFDSRVFGGSATDAGNQALTEMSAASARVVTSVLDKTVKPLIDKVPGQIKDFLGDLAEPAGLIRWALRAARRGMELLGRLVSTDLLERSRSRIDQLLAGLVGGAEDVVVIVGVAIGADQVRPRLAALDVAQPERDQLVDELAKLSAKYERLCVLLRRTAIAIAGLGSLLALLQVTLPHAAALTAAGLATVLGTTIVLGRDYTGAGDLPGRVRGVLLLVEDKCRAPG